MMGQWYGGYGGFGFLMPLMFLGIVAVYVILLVVVWRAMKAHESLAGSMKEIAENLKLKREP
jgi:uncharacterized membrane protein